MSEATAPSPFPPGINPPAGSSYARAFTEGRPWETDRDAFNQAYIDDVTQIRRAADATRDPATLDALDRDNAIRNVDQQTMRIPPISDSGNFESGDFRGFLRGRYATPGDPLAFDRLPVAEQARVANDGVVQRDYINAAQAENMRRNAALAFPATDPASLGMRELYASAPMSVWGFGPTGLPGRGGAAPARTDTTCGTCNPQAARPGTSSPRAPTAPTAPPARELPRDLDPPALTPPAGATVLSTRQRVGVTDVTGAFQGEVRRANVDAKRAEIEQVLTTRQGTLPEVQLVPDPARPGRYAVFDGNHTLQAYREMGVTEFPARVYNAESGVPYLDRRGAWHPDRRFDLSEMRVVPDFSGTPAQQRAARSGR